MAPEYAMHGQFSVKSDVFSFGVLLLEIVSGQKNNCFRHGEHVGDLLSYVSTKCIHLCLHVSYFFLMNNNNFISSNPSSTWLISIQAWKNWREGTNSNLVDPLMRDGSGSEITRCIHIGLLCVQENIGDRPSMNTVALMLKRYSLSLPVPSQPAFFMHSGSESDHSKSESAQASTNDASISELYPR